MTEAKAVCPKCGKSRTYSSDSYARFAERRGVQCKPCANLAWKKHGFLTGEFKHIRNRARQRNKYWNLSLADVSNAWDRQNGKCALSGLPMVKTPRTWSIDRIDNSCGYTPGNIQLVLKSINMMRGPLSVEEFTELCQAIVSQRSNYETD